MLKIMEERTLSLSSIYSELRH